MALKSRRYHGETIMDAHNVDDIVLLAYTPTQAELLLHSLKLAAGRIGVPVNANKTGDMCFNREVISTLSGGLLKFKFTYLGDSISSTESDVNICLGKLGTAIDRLLIIQKSDLSDKIKRDFFQAAVMSILLYGCTTRTLTKRIEPKLDGNYIRMLRTTLNKC